VAFFPATSSAGDVAPTLPFSFPSNVSWTLRQLYRFHRNVSRRGRCGALSFSQQCLPQGTLRNFIIFTATSPAGDVASLPHFPATSPELPKLSAERENVLMVKRDVSCLNMTEASSAGDVAPTIPFFSATSQRQRYPFFSFTFNRHLGYFHLLNLPKLSAERENVLMVKRDVSFLNMTEASPAGDVASLPAYYYPKKRSTSLLTGYSSF
jgi:hypothetical protein